MLVAGMKRIPFDAGCQYFPNETLSISLKEEWIWEKSGKISDLDLLCPIICGPSPGSPQGLLDASARWGTGPKKVKFPTQKHWKSSDLSMVFLEKYEMKR